MWKILLGFILTCFLCISQLTEATTTRDVFTKYPNRYFIETGSFLGDGVQMALEAGFEQIYSIELAPHYYQHCCSRFASYPNVTILQGNSTTVLPELLKHIDSPATFWLDGHYSCGINSGKGDTNCPILAELENIRQHPIKTHTILIDDIRLFGTIHFDFIALKEVIGKILTINPNYKICFEDGVVPNDVLVAYIP